MKYSLFFCLLITQISLFAQSKKPAVKEVEITERLEITRNETFLTTKYDVINLAKENAIKDAFGTAMYQATTTRIESSNENGQISGSDNYQSVSRSFARGVWLETTSETCESVRDKERDETWVICNLKGRVMEILTPQYDLEVEPMSCTVKGCERTDFRDGSDFYLRFQSPVDGYVAVYLDFRKAGVVQFLQPSPNSSSAKVTADKDLILFKDSGYELFTDDEQELDILYVIFSKTAFEKPRVKEKSVTLPKELSSKDFENWLALLRSRQPETQVKEIAITINKD